MEKMSNRSEISIELYKLMQELGYPEEFCEVITQNLNTDFTARRMIGYLSYYDHAKVEQVVDEMLAILSDRERIMQKKALESNNAAWNDFLNNGFDMEDEE